MMYNGLDCGKGVAPGRNGIHSGANTHGFKTESGAIPRPTADSTATAPAERKSTGRRSHGGRKPGDKRHPFHDHPSTYEIVPPTIELLNAMARELRSDDLIEVVQSGYDDSLHALVASVDISDYSALCLANGIPVAVWGLVVDSVLGQTGSPWLLTAPGIEHHKRMFLRHSRRVIQSMRRECPRGLVALIGCDYPKAHRWATWLGFVLTGPIPHPLSGEPFMEARI